MCILETAYIAVGNLAALFAGLFQSFGVSIDTNHLGKAAASQLMFEEIPDIASEVH